MIADPQLITKNSQNPPQIVHVFKLNDPTYGKHTHCWDGDVSAHYSSCLKSFSHPVISETIRLCSLINLC